MFPIRDNNPTRRRPIVTWALIGLNLAVFVYELGVQYGSPEGDLLLRELITRFGVVPQVLTEGDWLSPRSAGGAFGALVTPLTSLFLHASPLHLLGNMWFLYIFGDNVEDSLGRGRFIFFYLVCGLTALGGQMLIDPTSSVPVIGASGAISGVLAGYVLLYPHARVVTLVPIFIVIQFIEVPAFLYIFVWFAIQLLQGYLSLDAPGGGGVAWFAHIGGFIAGLALVRVLRPRTPPGEAEAASGVPE